MRVYSTSLFHQRRSDNFFLLQKGFLGASVLGLCFLLLSTVGCSRSYYRQQADNEAYALVAEKTADPRWPLENFSIEPDYRSRMFDPFSLDCPPIPLDDPASGAFMDQVYCMDGYEGWYSFGERDQVENSDWQAYLPKNEEGLVPIELDESVRLALMHSDTYQRRLENLYLAALDVSFERFQFDTQFFGGFDTDYFADGHLRGGGSSRSQLTAATSGVRGSHLYATGGNLVVDFANSFVWQFAGANTNTTSGLLDFTLVQPLLRGGGRERVLESLTQSERDLLAEVREMERFRRGFYLQIVTGRSPTSLSTPGSASGYMGLLQSQQSIKNQEANIASLRSSLSQLDAFFRAGRIDFFQVELARQALLNGQSRLLTLQANYQNRLDSFKQTLGLPPELPIHIEDPLLEPFNLVDSKTVPIQNKLTELQEVSGDLIVEILELRQDREGASVFLWDEGLRETLGTLQEHIKTIQDLRTTVVEINLPRADEDIKRLERAIPERKETLALLLSSLTKHSSVGIDPKAFSSERLDLLPEQLRLIYLDLIEGFSELETELATLEADVRFALEEGEGLSAEALTAHLQEKVLAEIPSKITKSTAEVLELTLLQARARSETITLEPVQLGAEEALTIASEHRRDWMNRRAELVDSWRLIEFRADDLESSVDIVFSGDIGNRGNNPLKLRSTNGRLSVGLEIDAPITRLSERNSYRRAQIEYQRARRSYYIYRDQIAQSLRGTLRTVDLNRLNFELQRAAVQVSIAQVELARLRLQQPPRPNAGRELGATTARDLVQALTSLLSAQNDFLSIWVNYEALRRSLDYDLGTMQIDEEGLWVDPGMIDETIGLSGDEGEDPLAQGSSGLPFGQVMDGATVESPPSVFQLP
ncbi:MAG: TolC family protein [Pirellulaceae bacterium]|nr:TolC family protein [Pirellulaceae bacterium]